MAGDIQRRIQLLVDGDKSGDRTTHVVEVALKAGHVLHDLVLRAGLERHGKEFHHAHRVGQTLEGGTIAFPNTISGRSGFAGGIGHTERLEKRVGHAHEAEVARHEVVDFSTLALHALAGGFEIKVAGAKHDVREQFEELNHGLLAGHGHHGVEDVAGFGHTKVRRSIVHFDALGRCSCLV